MTEGQKKFLLLAAAVVVPGGLAIAGLALWRMNRRKAAWVAGLVGAPVADPVAYAAKLATKAGADPATGQAVGLNQYALARMMQSEGKSEEDRIVRGQVATNDARQHFGGNVFRTITARRPYVAIEPGAKGQKASKKEYPRAGYFGEQGAGGRYSSVKEPSRATIALAGRLLRGEIPDRTHGATRFLDVKAFKSQKGVKRTFAEVDAKWKAEGFRPVQPTGSKDFLVYTNRSA